MEGANFVRRWSGFVAAMWLMIFSGSYGFANYSTAEGGDGDKPGAAQSSERGQRFGRLAGRGGWDPVQPSPTLRSSLHWRHCSSLRLWHPLPCHLPNHPALALLDGKSIHQTSSALHLCIKHQSSFKSPSITTVEITPCMISHMW